MKPKLESLVARETQNEGEESQSALERIKAEFSILVELVKFDANGLLNFFIPYNLYVCKGGYVSNIFPLSRAPFFHFSVCY